MNDLYEIAVEESSTRGRINRFKKRLSHSFTMADFEKMLEDQESKCKICSKLLTKSKDMALDHCHVERRVRGILCRKCNTAIGLFGDNPDNLLNALIYLKTN